MSNFSNPPAFKTKYSHPADDSRLLFFVIDSVHIIKAQRNNWFNQKNGYFMYYPSFENDEKFQTASLSVLRKIYDIESTELLKFGLGLTRKALWPTNLERQSVSLALKIFNRNLVQGILELGEKHELMHYKETANYINIFCDWWDIANVKSVAKGKFKRNVMCEPITNKSDDIRKAFLSKFIDWLNRWEAMNADNGKLSRETHSALRHTSQAYLDIMEYCSSNFGLSYLLLGKIQTDRLESRFGLYRSMAGDQYHISIRQLYETESKLRISKELKLVSHTSGSFSINIFHSDSDTVDDINEDVEELFEEIEVTDSDLDKVAHSLPIITYLAGYCVHTVHKSLKCLECKKRLVTDKEMNIDVNCNLIKKL
ncbi:transposable element P transposase [Parasteatoda tepidariorum]|uniref:transposable element P transposase n=1 Tax=Parasteatoda tepidariorum TaxID=114398 RepID=UPI0039BD07E6